jgi:hypothetical protein
MNSLRAPVPPPEIALEGAHRRDEVHPTPRWVALAIVGAGLLLVAFGIWLTQGAGAVEDQRDAATEQVRNLGREVTQACAQGDVVQSPDGQDLCRQGAEAQSVPVPAAVTGERGPGPTAEEIEAAVATYCAARNSCAGRAPTTSEVAGAVTEYLTANPPQPGRPPTAAEITDAVATYFAANPVRDGQDGTDGRDGERGPGPTAEEIQAAVAAELARNPPPRGEAGPTCPPGSSLRPVLFASGERGLGCVTEDAPTTTAPMTTAAPPTTEAPDDDPGGLLGG